MKKKDATGKRRGPDSGKSVKSVTNVSRAKQNLSGFLKDAPQHDSVGHSRARDPEEGLPPVDISTVDPTSRRARVRFLAHLIADNTYVKGRTNHELAALWGMKPQAVSEDASDAKLVLDTLIDEDALRLRLLTRVDQVVFDENAAHRDIIAGATAMANMAGITKTRLQLEPADAATAWKRVRGWLTDPSPELVRELNAAGWYRREVLEAKGEHG